MVKQYRRGGMSTLYRGMGYATRAFQAAAAAGAARKTFKKSKVTTTTRNKLRPRAAGRLRSRAAGNSITMTKRNSSVKQNFSTENTSTALSVPRRKASVATMLGCMMEPQWYRVQGITQYDTTTGFYPIANRAVNDVTLPIHVWDITATANYIGTQVLYPDVGFALSRGNNNGDSLADTKILPSQGPDGVTVSNSQLREENTSGGFDDKPKRKCFHEYTHLKLNLYGVRKRSTKFVCQLIQIKDTAADFITANSNNNEKKKLYDYLARPFVFNNLQTGDPQTKTDFKIIKSYEVNIAPNTNDQYDGVNATPHIHTLNWFIKHNRVRHYDWKRDVPATISQTPSWDIELGSGHNLRVDPKYRVYFVIRALSPDRRQVEYTEATDPISEPSYDLILKQKFLNPT